MLATGGGLVFTGKLTGDFIALDRRHRQDRLAVQDRLVASTRPRSPTRYKGRQYVTIASGLGGGLANRYAQDKVPTGGSIWTFALLP